jgi:hypothetical protein
MRSMMTINTFSKLRILSGIMAVLLLCDTIMAYGGQQEELPLIRNVHTVSLPDQVVIHYDLIALADTVYTVRVVLKKKSDPAYSFIPVNVRGDVGDSVAAGVDRTIEWEVKGEVPEGLDDPDLYIDVEIVREGAGSSSSKIWWIVGGAVVGGGVALLLLLKSGSTTSGGTELPDPIGRPQR